MINTYSRGNVTLTVDDHCREGNVTFTISREAPLTDDDVRRVNMELSDYPAANGARLERSSTAGEWEVRAGAVTLAGDGGDPTADLQWTVAQ